MHIMSTEYSNTFFKQCNQCFPSLKKDFKNDLKWFENGISMKKKLCAPLDYNITHHFLVIIILKIKSWLVNYDFKHIL